jgi:hypothetical protein
MNGNYDYPQFRRIDRSTLFGLTGLLYKMSRYEEIKKIKDKAAVAVKNLRFTLWLVSIYQNNQ